MSVKIKNKPVEGIIPEAKPIVKDYSEKEEEEDVPFEFEEKPKPVNKKPLAKPLKNVEVKQAVGTVSTTHKDGSIVETKENVGGEVAYQEATANVGISVGLTRNLGNYESIKFTVSIHLPCLPTEEDIEQTYEDGKIWVDNKIDAINQEITDNLGN